MPADLSNSQQLDYSDFRTTDDPSQACLSTLMTFNKQKNGEERHREKCTLFFVLHKTVPNLLHLVSENEFGEHCSLHFPRHWHEDKDPGWLALAWLHQDTDLNGPT